MNTNDTLGALSNTELETKLKSLNMRLGALTGIKMVLYAVCIYGILTKENKTVFLILIAVAFALTGLIAMVLKKKQKIQKEIQLRSKSA